jgi:hypothetical protein
MAYAITAVYLIGLGYMVIGHLRKKESAKN